MDRAFAAAGLAVALAGVCAASAGGAALPVVPDGDFGEWRGRAAAKDRRGDGAEGALDLRRLWLADDGEALFLRLEVGRETLLQNPAGATLGNRLRLYLDLDDSKATGRGIEDLGVELEVRFGERQILVYDRQGSETLENPGRGRVTGFPTHSADAFEIRVLLPAGAFGGARGVSGRGRLSLFLREDTPGGDRLPDAGAVGYALAPGPIGPPDPIEARRDPGATLRILSLNVEDSNVVSQQKVYRRLLRLVEPDVIAFQSLTAWGPEETLAFVEKILGPPPAGRWQAEQVADCLTVSSWPIRAASPVDGNLVTYLEAPDGLGGRDLVLFNAHTPCCDNDAGRDAEVDRLMATWRDLLEGRGPFPIDPRDAVILAGDFNLVGFRRQFEALRDGTFIDPARGPDFAPGRDGASLAVPPLRHTHARLVHTWRRDTSPFAPGRLDFVFFSADALELVRGFVLDSAALPRKTRKGWKLKKKDSLRASDHLPLVVDFTFD